MKKIALIVLLMASNSAFAQRVALTAEELKTYQKTTKLTFEASDLTCVIERGKFQDYYGSFPGPNVINNEIDLTTFGTLERGNGQPFLIF